MADTVVQETRQQFSVDAAGATVNLLKLANAATGVGQALTMAQTAASVLSGPINTIIGHLSGVVAIQARMEERRLSLAGQLTAYNAVGDATQRIRNGNQAAADAVTQMSRNFEMANTRASQLMQTIQEQAAALPGSAEDYLTVFDSALPAALANTRRSLSDILNASNLFAAIGVVNNQQIDMVGRDFALMMQGLAGQQVNMFRILRPLMTTRQGRQIQTGEQFNRMRGEERFETLQRAMERFRPLMDRFADTWSTQVGTFESSILALKRAVTQNIFLILRQQLGDINSIMARMTPLAVRIGRIFETYFAESLKTAYNTAKSVGREILSWATKTIMSSSVLQRVMSTGERLFGGARRFIGHNANGRGAHTMLAGLGLANFSGFLALLQNTTQFNKVMNSVNLTLNSLAVAFQLMWSALSQAIAVYDKVYVALAPLAALIGEVYAAFVEGIGWFLTGMISVLEHFPLQRALNALATITDALSAAFHYMKPGLVAVMHIIGTVAGMIFYVIGSVFLVGLEQIATAFKTLKSSLTLLVEKIQEWLPESLTNSTAFRDAAQNASRYTAQDDSVGANSEVLNRIRSAFNWTAEGARAAVADSPRGRQNQQRPHTNNDFRYSRFDITQKFAEGFDPDRIAAVFARDLEGLAEQRMSSGFNPAFSVM